MHAVAASLDQFLIIAFPKRGSGDWAGRETVSFLQTQANAVFSHVFDRAIFGHVLGLQQDEDATNAGPEGSVSQVLELVEKEGAHSGYSGTRKG